ncbi:hypothetical protein GmHk_07G019739 [Glycine max]|nr:hypothetical protein GmHk_07G019739 [Glycine max]
MQRCFHLISGVSRKLTDCASIFFWFFGMSWNFTNCLMMGAKHLTRTKEWSHVIEQRSPDEIRVTIKSPHANDLLFPKFHKLPNDGCQAPHKDQRMVACHQAKVPENQCMTLISLLSVDESRGRP